MNERYQWERYFIQKQQERDNDRYTRELVSWSDATSRKLSLERVKERKNGLSPVRLHNTDELS